MRRLMQTAVLAIGLAAAPVLAQDGDPAIEGVIQSQLEAFLADDFATAFTFASPTIKGMFGTSDNFGMMVRRGYPMVWRPADVQYLEQELRGGVVHQKVLITDESGVPYVLDYEMIETGDGWQINGVQILQTPPVGA